MSRRRQAVTIKHVAAEAGVSLQTVSRVINNGANVHPDMKARVQKAIDLLGYVPSIAAQRMSGSRSYLILALNDRDRTIADWQARQGTDWVDQMLLGGMLTCSEHGYRMMIELVDTHSDHVERELRRTIAALQPDGVLLTPPHSENAQIIGLLADEKIPFARIGCRDDGPGFQLGMDDARAARLCVEHLVTLGHAKIGLISGASDYALSQWRIDGWREAMAAAGLATDGLLAPGDFSFASGEKGAAALLDAGATGIIASSDQMALATLETARARGLDVPADLSIISFDNTPVVRFTMPPLTAVDQPIAETVSRACDMLIRAKSGEDVDPAPVMVPASLITRESTAAPRGR